MTLSAREDFMPTEIKKRKPRKKKEEPTINIPQPKSLIEMRSVEWFDDRFYKAKYTQDGLETERYIPSVTTKLGAVAKPYLLKWVGDLGSREAELRRHEQAERGSRIHFAWQVLTTRGAVLYNPPRNPQFTNGQVNELHDMYHGNICIIQNQDEMYDVDKLQKFYIMLDPVKVEAERTVYDLEMNDAGTADTIFSLIGTREYQFGRSAIELPEGQYVMDLKTGSYVGKEARMQVSCYFKCLAKMGYKNMVGALIVHTKSNTKTGIEGLSVDYLDIAQIEEEYSDYRHVSSIWEKMFGSMKPMVREIPNIITLRL